MSLHHLLFARHGNTLVKKNTWERPLDLFPVMASKPGEDHLCNKSLRLWSQGEALKAIKPSSAAKENNSRKRLFSRALKAPAIAFKSAFSRLSRLGMGIPCIKIVNKISVEEQWNQGREIKFLSFRNSPVKWDTRYFTHILLDKTSSNS